MYFQLCPLLDRNKNRSQQEWPASPYTALFVQVWLQTVQKYPRNSLLKRKWSTQGCPALSVPLMSIHSSDLFSELLCSMKMCGMIIISMSKCLQKERMKNDGDSSWLLMFRFLVFFYRVAFFLSSSLAFTFYSMHLNAAALDRRAVLYHISRK